MQRRILLVGLLTVLVGCGYQSVRNRGIDYLGSVRLSNIAYRDWHQLKTGGVNGPDVTLVIERHCEPYNGPIECTITNVKDAGAPGLLEAAMRNAIQGLFQFGGLTALGALMPADRVYQNQSIGSQTTNIPVTPAMTPMPMGMGPVD